jgi:hypothetical protein
MRRIIANESTLDGEAAMPGPFPGMDPYMENWWGETHIRLMVATSSQIRQQLPRDLDARIEENPFWDDEHRRERDDPITERWIHIVPRLADAAPGTPAGDSRDASSLGQRRRD